MSPKEQPLHPADRAHIATEQRNPRTMRLHEMSVRECVDAIRREDAAVIEALEDAAPALAGFIEDVAPRFALGGRLVYLGAGTSGRLGVLDAAEAPPTFQLEHGRIVGIIAGGDGALRRSSEALEDDPEGARPELEALALTDKDSVLAIAAGATTPYARGGLAVAKRLSPGCCTGFLACAPTEAPPACDHLIVAPTGPEALTGSTRMKAGTATKMALNTISTTLMVQTGRVHENLMVDLRATNDKLRDRAARILAALTGLQRDAAFGLLARAGGAVKTAAVMHLRNVGREEAERRLSEAGDRLDRALRD
jgi:N-acetylmuramic acid 6-phosphate etherase